jgi:hypothetical protein
MDTKKLQRGDMVRAAKNLDVFGANVSKGTLGVVFEEADFYGEDEGPMVRWFTGTACNVYDGDVVSPDEEVN